MEFFAATGDRICVSIYLASGKYGMGKGWYLTVSIPDFFLLPYAVAQW